MLLGKVLDPTWLSGHEKPPELLYQDIPRTVLRNPVVTPRDPILIGARQEILITIIEVFDKL